MKKQSDVSVFEKYAHEYDLMTNAVQREEYHAKEIKALIEKYNPKSVLDAGCATGLTSMLFAREGISTVGLDRSKKILEVAKTKYKDSSYPLTFRFGKFEKLPKTLYGKFDMVVSLANSISGVHTRADLFYTLNNFNMVLKPGGVLILQILNYETLEENRLRPIKATNNDGIIYIRFSERHRKRFFVYAIRVDTNVNPPQYELFRHDFDNFSRKEVIKILKESNFKKIEKYACLYLKSKFTQLSKDLVLVAHKAKK